MAAPRRAVAALRPWDALVDACARLPFVPHDIAAQLDAGGRYEMPLDDEFPFAISLFHYRSDLHTRGSTWHERLELFVPVEGRTLFRMGEREFDLNLVTTVPNVEYRVHLTDGKMELLENPSKMPHGSVVDFVDAYWGTFHFWAFNVADSAITVGVALMILDMIGTGTHASNPA